MAESHLAGEIGYGEVEPRSSSWKGEKHQLWDRGCIPQDIENVCVWDGVVRGGSDLIPFITKYEKIRK